MASRTSLIRSIESPKLTRDDEEGKETGVVHAVENRAEVATLPPVLVSLEVPLKKADELALWANIR